jgi:hypothetical protein
MNKNLKKVLAVYENGEATIGRKVDQHDETLAVLINTVSDLCGIVVMLEAREKAFRSAGRFPD